MKVRGREVELTIALGIVICFAVLGLIDYARQAREVAQYDTFSTYDFAPGGYRAWFDLLRSEGVNVERDQQRASFVTDAVSTLVMANNLSDALLRMQMHQPAGLYGPGDYAVIAKWVRAGGRLIWLTDQTGSMWQMLESKDSLQTLHLPVVEPVKPAKDRATPVGPSPFAAGVRWVQGSGNLRMPVNSNLELTPLLADKRGVLAGFYRLGKGSVFVVGDESLFENRRLSKADNARFAYDLVATGLPSGATVAFEEWSHGYQSGTTWWSILPHPFQLALLVLSGCALLALVATAWRFGPAQPLPDTTERTSAEYLASMAGLLERAGAARRAVRDLARLGLGRAALAVGLPEGTSASAIATRLRTRSRDQRWAGEVLTLERIAGYEQPSRDELMTAARIAIDLRKEFSLDGLQRFEPRRATARRSA